MDGTGTGHTVDSSSVQNTPIVEIGPSASWILGTAVTVGSLLFVVVGVFEAVVYDIPTLGPAWGPSLLVGSVGLWFALATTAAKRLRLDTDGVHTLGIFRRRSYPWSAITAVGVRPARVPVVDGVVTFDAGGSIRTPWSLNGGDTGSAGLLDKLAPALAAYFEPIT